MGRKKTGSTPSAVRNSGEPRSHPSAPNVDENRKAADLAEPHAPVPSLDAPIPDQDVEKVIVLPSAGPMQPTSTEPPMSSTISQTSPPTRGHADRGRTLGPAGRPLQRTTSTSPRIPQRDDSDLGFSDSDGCSGSRSRSSSMPPVSGVSPWNLVDKQTVAETDVDSHGWIGWKDTSLASHASVGGVPDDQPLASAPRGQANVAVVFKMNSDGSSHGTGGHDSENGGSPPALDPGVPPVVAKAQSLNNRTRIAVLDKDPAVLGKDPVQHFCLISIIWLFFAKHKITKIIWL